MLDMQHVTKTFNGFKALDDLSMTVPKGAVYGLVGPNGAGKSTAIRLITGVYRPDSGNITLEGLPVFENPVIKERICSIPDDIFYFPSATMEDMHKYYKGLYPHFDDALYNKLYEVFNLPKSTQLPLLQGHAEAGGFPSEPVYPSGCTGAGRARGRSGPGNAATGLESDPVGCGPKRNHRADLLPQSA